MVIDKKAYSRIHNREWYQKNKEFRRGYMREYYQEEENKKKKDSYMKEYGQRPLVKERIKKYELDNRERFRERTRKYLREWMGNEYKKNGHYTIRIRLGNLLNQVLKQYLIIGKIRTSKKYGIDYKAIIEHLKPFPKDMKNYHIDHIIPLSRFDFNNPEHIKKAFMPKNHQWLTIKENLEKGNKLIMPH